MRTVWLIQRATINSPLSPPNTRLSNAVRFDYMGSAEFEFGTLPASLRRIQAGFSASTICLVDDILEEDRPLRVFSYFDDEQFNEYVSILRDLRTKPFGTVHLKERSEFSLDERTRFSSSRADFWWDIENDVMFSFNKNFMNRLMDYLSASFTYMNERNVAK